MKTKELGPNSQPSSLVCVNPRISAIRSCRHTDRGHNRNRVRLCRPSLHRKRCNIFHPVAADSYKPDFYTYYRLPLDSPDPAEFFGAYVESSTLNQFTRNRGCYARVVLEQCDVRSQRCSTTVFSHLAQQERRHITSFDSTSLCLFQSIVQDALKLFC